VINALEAVLSMPLDFSVGTPSVVSSLSGKFTLRGATLTFVDLSFGVPGAIVQIAGTYDVKNELLDFRGHLLLDVSLADTTSGFKAIIARVAHPCFAGPAAVRSYRSGSLGRERSRNSG
jgi:hypothetical protein